MALSSAFCTHDKFNLLDPRILFCGCAHSARCLAPLFQSPLSHRCRPSAPFPGVFMNHRSVYEDVVSPRSASPRPRTLIGGRGPCALAAYPAGAAPQAPRCEALRPLLFRLSVQLAMQSTCTSPRGSGLVVPISLKYSFPTVSLSSVDMQCVHCECGGLTISWAFPFECTHEPRARTRVQVREGGLVSHEPEHRGTQQTYVARTLGHWG